MYLVVLTLFLIVKERKEKARASPEGLEKKVQSLRT
jgi:hypothetical protein